MEEIWKDIKGYEGLYQVSNLGRVKSFDRYMKNKHGTYTLKKGRILKNSILKSTGYLRVSLSHEGKFISKQVHRLVAEAFIPNPNNYPIINHKDENILNPRADNLEWCTYKYNNNYGNTAIKKSITHKINQKNSKKVYQYDLYGNFIKEWKSTREVARFFNIDNNTISRCCRNLKKSALGYKWQYHKEKDQWEKS